MGADQADQHVHYEGPRRKTKQGWKIIWRNNGWKLHKFDNEYKSTSLRITTYNWDKRKRDTTGYITIKLLKDNLESRKYQESSVRFPTNFSPGNTGDTKGQWWWHYMKYWEKTPFIREYIYPAKLIQTWRKNKEIPK